MDAKPDILNHNIETVRRLTPRVRAKAKYDRSLEFLRKSKRNAARYSNKIIFNDWTWETLGRNFMK